MRPHFTLRPVYRCEPIFFFNFNFHFQFSRYDEKKLAKGNEGKKQGVVSFKIHGHVIVTKTILFLLLHL